MNLVNFCGNWVAVLTRPLSAEVQQRDMSVQAVQYTGEPGSATARPSSLLNATALFIEEEGLLESSRSGREIHLQTNPHDPSSMLPPTIASGRNLADKHHYTFSAKERELRDVLHDIQEGRIFYPEDVPQMKTEFYDIANWLLADRKRDGEVGFNRAYNVLSALHPLLEKWRPDFNVPYPPQWVEERRIRGVRLSEIEPEPITWLWSNRLALGKFTMLDGDPGTGKSSISYDLIARISTGRPMPDGTPCLSGSVAVMALEDGLSDTVVPRLGKVGADLDKIVSLGTLKVPDQETGEMTERPSAIRALKSRVKRAVLFPPETSE